MGCGDLTNAQWVRLAPLLPKDMKPGRPPNWTRRQLIDGIRWRARAATPWRDVLERHGPWDRVCDLFRRRQRNGTWAGNVTRPQAQADGPSGAASDDPGLAHDPAWMFLNPREVRGLRETEGCSPQTHGWIS
ncbi:transposase [Streptomyces sp. NPDC037389]|uniref:transposase n=1 Tax=Streptomyces sp. NPDC037389 TaxID=3155369 RepID=UPI0033CF2F6C